MTLRFGIVFVAGIVASLIALARWLRVAQREHYIPGSCLATARRWVTRRPPNLTLAVATVIAAFFAVTVSSAELSTAWAVVAAVGAATFPFPMTVLGKDAKLRATRRLLTLAGFAVVLAAIVGVALALAFSADIAPLIVAVLMPALVDGAAALAAPLEQRLLARHRDRAVQKLAQVKPRVIAVTGSWGKTSTKNHIRDLLTGTMEVVASPASFNNTAGLSRTVNEHLTPGCEVLVAEFGAYRPGEIRSLCSWMPPDIAVICAIGPMHLERMKTLDAIVAAKSEIVEPAHHVVLWVDDPRLSELADRLGDKDVWRVGSGLREDLAIRVEAGDDRVSILRGEQLLGSYSRASGVHPANAACAVAAVLAAGVDERTLAPKIERLSGPPHRGEAIRSDLGLWVIDDTFNSNPEGARAALAALQRVAPGGRRAVVTPGMIELGGFQDEANHAFAAAATAGDDTLVIVGWTNRKALLSGARGRAVLIANREGARQWVRANLGESDAVLWENDLPDHYP